jgi:RNA polymerase sigma-70 factor (ECF subfamily)
MRGEADSVMGGRILSCRAQTTSSLPDIILVDVKQRFDALFAAYRSDIVAYCTWRAATASDAEDAVAEVFLIAWRRFDELPDGNARRIWLYATARRVLANQHRSRRRRVALQDRLAESAATEPQDWPPSRTSDGVVHEALRRLSPRDREVLLLAEWEGLTPSEISTVLNCPTVTARGRLHRARLRFRSVYETLHEGESPHHRALSTQPARIPEGGA